VFLLEWSGIPVKIGSRSGIKAAYVEWPNDKGFLKSGTIRISELIDQ